MRAFASTHRFRGRSPSGPRPPTICRRRRASARAAARRERAAAGDDGSWATPGRPRPLRVTTIAARALLAPGAAAAVAPDRSERRSAPRTPCSRCARAQRLTRRTTRRGAEADVDADDALPRGERPRAGSVGDRGSRARGAAGGVGIGGGTTRWLVGARSSMTRDQGRVLQMSSGDPVRRGSPLHGQRHHDHAGGRIHRDVRLRRPALSAPPVPRIEDQPAVRHRRCARASKIESLTVEVKASQRLVEDAAAASYLRAARQDDKRCASPSDVLIGIFLAGNPSSTAVSTTTRGRARRTRSMGGGEKTISRRRRSFRPPRPSPVVQLDHFEARRTWLRTSRRRERGPPRVRAFRNRRANEHPRFHRKRVSFLNTSPANSVPGARASPAARRKNPAGPSPRAPRPARRRRGTRRRSRT